MQTWLPLLSLHPFLIPLLFAFAPSPEAGPSLGTVSGAPPGTAPVSFCSGCSFLPLTATPQAVAAVEMESVVKSLGAGYGPVYKHMGWGGRSIPLGTARAAVIDQGADADHV